MERWEQVPGQPKCPMDKLKFNGERVCAHAHAVIKPLRMEFREAALKFAEPRKRRGRRKRVIKLVQVRSVVLGDGELLLENGIPPSRPPPLHPFQFSFLSRHTPIVLLQRISAFFKNLNSFVSFTLYSSLLLLSLRILVVLCNVIRISYFLVRPIRKHTASSIFHLWKMFFRNFSTFDFLPFLSPHDCFYVVLGFVRVIRCFPGLLPSFQGFGMILFINLSRTWPHASSYLASISLCCSLSDAYFVPPFPRDSFSF